MTFTITIERGDKMIKKQPVEITTCTLQCLLMPQGEIISGGKTIGWFKDLKKYLTEVKDEK